MPVKKTYEKKLGLILPHLKDIEDSRDRERMEEKYMNCPPYKYKGKLFMTKDGLPACVPDQWSDRYFGPFMPLPKQLKVKEIG